MKSYYQMTREEKLQAMDKLPVTKKELKFYKRNEKKDAKKLKTKK